MFCRSPNFFLLQGIEVRAIRKFGIDCQLGKMLGNSMGIPVLRAIYIYSLDLPNLLQPRPPYGQPQWNGSSEAHHNIPPCHHSRDAGSRDWIHVALRTQPTDTNPHGPREAPRPDIPSATALSQFIN